MGRKAGRVMFDWNRKETGCRKYRAELEESLVGGVAHIGSGSETDAHLHECAPCREALNDALLASKLMRNARVARVEPSEAFVTRVMASIRQQVSQQAAPGAIWRPLETLASRFALAATMALLVLSLYAAQISRSARVSPVTSQTVATTGLLEPPAQPADQDEVLVSLAADQGNE
jgi:hypothetical protein